MIQKDKRVRRFRFSGQSVKWYPSLLATVERMVRAEGGIAYAVPGNPNARMLLRMIREKR